MKPGWIETRKRMFKQKMNDPEYLKPSYEKQKENILRKREDE